MTLSLELLNYINYFAFSITNNLHIKQMESFLLLIKIKELTTTTWIAMWLQSMAPRMDKKSWSVTECMLSFQRHHQSLWNLGTFIFFRRSSLDWLSHLDVVGCQNWELWRPKWNKSTLKDAVLRHPCGAEDKTGHFMSNLTSHTLIIF